MARHKRDIYKGRFEKGFNIDRDVDLAHLRSIMAIEEPSNDDLNHYGLYCKNIIKIMLNSAKFRGYPDEIKENMDFEALVDMLKARTKFKGEQYPAPTAPFNYLFRIGFHGFQRVLVQYYKHKDEAEIVPASLVGLNVRTSNGDAFDGDVLDKATDWDAIIENLN
jgi:hypothetical protein